VTSAPGEADHRLVAARLQEIPNVGPRMAEDLPKLGVAWLEDAAGRDPDETVEDLRRGGSCGQRGVAVSVLGEGG
jgi:hypothetical protein